MMQFYEQNRKVYKNADVTSYKIVVRVSFRKISRFFLFQKISIYFLNFFFRECKSYSDNPLCDYIDNDGKEGFGQGTDVREKMSEQF